MEMYGRQVVQIKERGCYRLAVIVLVHVNKSRDTVIIIYCISSTVLSISLPQTVHLQHLKQR